MCLCNPNNRAIFCENCTDWMNANEIHITAEWDEGENPFRMGMVDLFRIDNGMPTLLDPRFLILPEEEKKDEPDTSDPGSVPPAP